MSGLTVGGNWSSTEGSTCDTMSVALSEMPDHPTSIYLQNQHHVSCTGIGNDINSMTPVRSLSPELHLVNRKELLEQMGLPPAPINASHHSRNQATSR